VKIKFVERGRHAFFSIGLEKVDSFRGEVLVIIIIIVPSRLKALVRIPLGSLAL
jgi:hypothetical protein